jgi:hypothetical protein
MGKRTRLATDLRCKLFGSEIVEKNSEITRNIPVRKSIFKKRFNRKFNAKGKM